jgi:ring-1,2-phenylacetyl-CoA epoxidase subunit PaaC
MAMHISEVSQADRFEYVMRLADDSLIYSHRLAEWTSWAPQIEEDLALTNIALDLLGQARALLSYAGEIEGEGNGEDDLAYLREEQDFRCCLLVEQPMKHDFGAEMARLLFYSAYSVPLMEAMSESRDQTLAEIAAKSLKEVRYHLEHAIDWVIRLGDGTEESHRRMQNGLEEMWPYAGELFTSDPVTDAMVRASIGADPERLKLAWDRLVGETLTMATLVLPTRPFQQSAGRRGRHSEHLGYLLAEMQYVHRLHPGARW